VIVIEGREQVSRIAKQHQLDEFELFDDRDDYEEVEDTE
jgi:hypothetical protein